MKCPALRIVVNEGSKSCGREATVYIEWGAGINHNQVGFYCETCSFPLLLQSKGREISQEEYESRMVIDEL
jgi:hypothetical protein